MEKIKNFLFVLFFIFWAGASLANASPDDIMKNKILIHFDTDTFLYIPDDLSQEQRTAIIQAVTETKEMLARKRLGFLIKDTIVFGHLDHQFNWNGNPITAGGLHWGSKRRVDIEVRMQYWQYKQVLVHELGHKLHHDYYGYSNPRFLRICDYAFSVPEDQKAYWFPTKYSQRNCHEWFAENFELYILGVMNPKFETWFEKTFINPLFR